MIFKRRCVPVDEKNMSHGLEPEERYIGHTSN